MTPSVGRQQEKGTQTPRRGKEAATPFTAIERVNRSEQVRKELEDAIRRGDYASGDRLPSERELGEMLGVSRVSIREAISALEAVGLVDVQQGRGSFVTATRSDHFAKSLGRWLDTHRQEIMELLKVRGALDELAAQEAARHAGPDQIRDIMQAHEAFSRAAGDRNTDLDTLEQLDIRFHESLAAAGENSLLLDLLHDLNHHLSASRKAALALEGRRRKATAEHLQIYEAIKAGRPDQARARARKHLEATGRVLKELSEQGLTHSE